MLVFNVPFHISFVWKGFITDVTIYTYFIVNWVKMFLEIRIGREFLVTRTTGMVSNLVMDPFLMLLQISFFRTRKITIFTLKWLQFQVNRFHMGVQKILSFERILADTTDKFWRRIIFLLWRSGCFLLKQ